jgi:hypothetical protein
MTAHRGSVIAATIAKTSGVPSMAATALEASELDTVVGGQAIEPARLMACMREVAYKGHLLAGLSATERDQRIRRACEQGVQQHDEHASASDRVGSDIMTGLARNPRR